MSKHRDRSQSLPILPNRPLSKYSLCKFLLSVNLRLDVSMKNTVLVHVIDRLDDLIHVEFDSLFWQIVSASFDCLIHIHIHEFENKSESACGLIVKHFVQSNYVRVRRETFEGLNFSEIVHLYPL